MANNPSSIRTAAAKVRYLGSAHAGTHHAWRMRITSLALVPLTIAFVPDAAPDWLIEAKRARPSATMRTVLREHLPQRLADVLAEQLGLASDLGNLSDKALRAAQERLARWQFQPNGTEGFAKAEVTAGGISTAELSSQTMEARKVPGLYAIGEAVDVTGWLGGYNFQWAWASGFACANAL